MFEAQKLEEQIRMDRVPTEEAWAQMLPLLRKGEEAPEQKTGLYARHFGPWEAKCHKE